MHIELRKLNVNKALSRDGTCFSAEIWIDGKPAFEATNTGNGGADHYRQLGTLTEAQVNAWLRTHRATRHYAGVTLDPNLEHEVALLIDEAEAVRALRRRTRGNVVTIENGAVFIYPRRGRALATMIAAIRSSKPDAEIVNGGEHAVLLRAARLILSADQTEGD